MEIGYLFISELVVGAVAGILVSRYVWPNASALDAVVGALPGSFILSLCAVFLYGIISEDLQRNYIVMLILFFMPIFGAISFMRFLRHRE